MGAKVRIDWDRLEPDWRANIKSPEQMAQEYTKDTGQKVTRPGIIKHFAKAGIPRDLTAKIKAKADQLVAKNASLKSSEKDIVEANATQSADIQIRQRLDVTRARTIAMSLLDELESQVVNKELYDQLGEILQNPDDKGMGRLNDLYQKVTSFPGKVDSMKKLSDAQKTLIELERRVYKIDEVQHEEGIEDYLRRMRGAVA